MVNWLGVGIGAALALLAMAKFPQLKPKCTGVMGNMQPQIMSLYSER